LFSLAQPAPAFDSGEWKGRVNAFFNGGKLSVEAGAHQETRPEFGALVDFKKEKWPVSVCADLFFRRAAWSGAVARQGPDPVHSTQEVAMAQIHLGVRKCLEAAEGVGPFLDGGLALVRAHGDLCFGPDSKNFDDVRVGPWVGAGVAWRTTKRFSLDLDLRYSLPAKDLDWEGADGQALCLGVFMGVSF